MPFPQSSFVQKGDYQDITEIGRGAHGLVYSAREVRTARYVAIKEAIPDNEQFEESRHRFDREVRVLARFHHPKILVVYTTLEDEQTKELYLVCEFANGGSLADHLRTFGPLDERTAIKIALDICDALEATSKKGIVHRDVKPRNILLFKDLSGNIETAKLGDFGIALGEEDYLSSSAATNHSHAGTPMYMAPEAEKRTNILNVQADIYALGLTLWEMLTNTRYKQVELEGEPNLHAYAPTASAGIASIIQKAVQTDPRKRYKTAQDMADDLRIALGDERTKTRRDPPPPPAPPRRSPRTMAALALFVLFLGGGYIISRLFDPESSVIDSTNSAGRVGSTPTDTLTPEPSPTNTPEPSPTNTPEPPPTNTPEPPPTNTPEPSPPRRSSSVNGLTLTVTEVTQVEGRLRFRLEAQNESNERQTLSITDFRVVDEAAIPYPADLFDSTWDQTVPAKTGSQPGRLTGYVILEEPLPDNVRMIKVGFKAINASGPEIYVDWDLQR